MKYLILALFLTLPLLFINATSPTRTFVIDASHYEGTLGQKISKSLVALNQKLKSSGKLSSGVIDARSVVGNQEIDVPLTLGTPWEHSVSLLLGPGKFQVSHTLVLSMKSSIIGIHGQTTLMAKSHSQLWALVSLGFMDRDWEGGSSVLRDLILDGNKDELGTVNNQNASVLLFQNAGNYSVSNVTVQNSNGHGMIYRFVRKADSQGHSGGLTLRSSVSKNNNLDGLLAQNTADSFIYNSTFMGNGGHGIELQNSPTLRMMHSKIIDNAGYGMVTYAPSYCFWCGLLIIVNNEFTNNCEASVKIEGVTEGKSVSSGNLFAHNTFKNGGCSKSHTAFDIRSSQGNVIGANTFEKNMKVLASNSLGQNSFVSNTGARFKVSSIDLVTHSDSAKFLNAPFVKDQSVPQPPLKSGYSSVVIDASKFSGASAGQKISNALIELEKNLKLSGKVTGIIDARELGGNQVIDRDLTFGKDGAYGVQLFLGGGIYEIQKPMRVSANSGIIGLPTGQVVASDWHTPGTVLKASNSANLWTVITLEGDKSYLHDLVVDGNYKKSGTKSDPFSSVVLVQNSFDVVLKNVTVMYGSGHGIGIRDLSSNPGTNWLNVKLDTVMSIGNSLSGLHVHQSRGVQIVQSSFEDNHHHGIEIENSPDLQIVNSDLGGSYKHGIYAYGDKSKYAVIIGNQFGNNRGECLRLEDSSSFRIAGNSFISGTQGDNQAAIAIDQGENNQIVSNFFTSKGTDLKVWKNWSSAISSNSRSSWVAGNMVHGNTSGEAYSSQSAGDRFLFNLNTP